MKKNVDVLIIGGGPAGLVAAQYGARAALKTMLVEQIAFGGQALMINTLENYPGNLTGKSGYEIAEEFRAQAEKFGVEFCSASVVSLQKTGTYFEAALDNMDTIHAIAVILTTGAGHRLLDVEGEARYAGRGVSYCASCDGPFFKNKTIFVAGGGDAACDEAAFLSRISSDITVIVRRGEFRAQKSLSERIMQNPAIKIRFWTRVVAILGNEKLTSLSLENTKTGDRQELAADALFVCAGIVPRTGLVESGNCVPEFDETGFIKTGQKMDTCIPGLFAAGDVRSSPFRQVIVAAGEGAVAAHAAAEYLRGLTA
jgi:thioredoxin reductase (NADPH)